MSKLTGNGLLAEFARAASQAPAIYFAPVLGALAGISGQLRKSHTAGHHKAA